MDAIVGHNGLVCAAYLLKAGYSALLLEKNSIPEGATTTGEALPQEAPSFKFNPCAIGHIFINLSPIVQELKLSKYQFLVAARRLDELISR